MSSKEIIEINQFRAESSAIRCCMHQIHICARASFYTRAWKMLQASAFYLGS
jgi:hypothetical protein